MCIYIYIIIIPVLRLKTSDQSEPHYLFAKRHYVKREAANDSKPPDETIVVKGIPSYYLNTVSITLRISCGW